MPSLSPGKMRGLQACATPEGIFAIMAVDHRDSLRAIIAPDVPQTVPGAQLTAVKLAVVAQLVRATSAVLLDPVDAQHQTVRDVIGAGSPTFLWIPRVIDNRAVRVAVEVVVGR